MCAFSCSSHVSLPLELILALELRNSEKAELIKLSVLLLDGRNTHLIYGVFKSNIQSVVWIKPKDARIIIESRYFP